jgi:putative toxin-antitoxin system antitoxin component (TIGR02293 family)
MANIDFRIQFRMLPINPPFSADFFDAGPASFRLEACLLPPLRRAGYVLCKHRLFRRLRLKNENIISQLSCTGSVKHSSQAIAPALTGVSLDHWESVMSQAKHPRKAGSLKTRQTAAQFDRILSVAQRVWGNEADATEWLNSPHPELQGATPFSLLKTEAGGRAVEALLGALEFGFPI